MTNLSVAVRCSTCGSCSSDPTQSNIDDDFQDESRCCLWMQWLSRFPGDTHDAVREPASGCAAHNVLISENYPSGRNLLKTGQETSLWRNSNYLLLCLHHTMKFAAVLILWRLFPRSLVFV